MDRRCRFNPAADLVCQACRAAEDLVCLGNQEAEEGFRVRGNPEALGHFLALDSPASPVDQRGQALPVWIRHGRRNRANRWRRCANVGAICRPQIASDSARMRNDGST